MSTRTRFEKEAKGNSEMAYWCRKQFFFFRNSISWGGGVVGWKIHIWESPWKQDHSNFTYLVPNVKVNATYLSLFEMVKDEIDNKWPENEKDQRFGRYKRFPPRLIRLTRHLLVFENKQNVNFNLKNERQPNVESNSQAGTVIWFPRLSLVALAHFSCPGVISPVLVILDRSVHLLLNHSLDHWYDHLWIHPHCHCHLLP